MEFILSDNTVHFLINLIKNKKNGTYIRFGDGDFNLMDGQHDMLAMPSQDIIDNYKLTIQSLTSTDMISIPFYCKSLNTLEIGMKPGIHEYPDNIALDYINRMTNYIQNLTKLYSHVALHQVLVHNPELYSTFLKTIIDNNSTIIFGNTDFDKEKINYYFGNNIYIGANSNNSFNERERIWEEFNKINIDKFTVCILALGCGGRAMSHKFIHKNMLIIDIGSSIDVLMGLRNTRAWVEMTNPNIDIINKILDSNTIKDSNVSLIQLGYKYNIDKTTYHNFTDLYDSLFNNIKNNVKLMIEVGDASGSSIKMWREYFKSSIIYGFDYNIELSKYIENIPNVIFSYVNQDSKDSLQKSVSNFLLNSVDIIIDDGGHFSSQQRNTLEVYWPYLKSGGFYIIEDIHTNVKHWYPNSIYRNNHKYYWDESPTLLETLTKLQYGIEIDKELSISKDEIKQFIIWSQPHTTSATFILIKR